MAPKGFVLWFTGLSGSGKSTLAAMVAAELRARGVHVETLDGDEIRKRLSRGLGFSREDRDENIRRIGFATRLVSRSGACAIAASISPYRSVRDEVRRSVDRFVEVYTECPIDVLAARDPKGLYKKALSGAIKNFTGVDDPYEAPNAPDVHLHTDRETPEESFSKIISRLEMLRLIPARGQRRADVTRKDALTLPLPHGQDLVDRFADADASSEWMSTTTVDVDLDASSYADFVGIANGAYSPLRGFMTSKDYLRVVREARLEQGLPWTMPVTLPLSEEQAERLEGERVVSLRHGGRRVGILDVADIWRPNREEEALAVLGSNDASNPRVARFRSRGAIYVGGEIRCIDQSDAGARSYPSPRSIRDDLRQRALRDVAAVLCDDPPFVFEEYVLRAALDFSDAVLSMCAESEHNAIPAEVRVRCYEALFERYLPLSRCVAIRHPWAKDGVPERRTVHDAIVAKNFGASRLVVIRRADDSSRYESGRYGRGELGIDVTVMEPAVRSADAGVTTAHTAPPGALPFDASLTIESIRRGVEIDAVRPEVAVILRQHLNA